MNTLTFPHQYICRDTSSVETERLIGDRTVHFLYNTLRENAPAMFNALTSKRMSSILGFFHYDLPVTKRINGEAFFSSIGADWNECVEDLSYFDSQRKVFERKIRYWDTRPLPVGDDDVLSPADSRIILGSFNQSSQVFLKNKFFEIRELLGLGCPWYPSFIGGDYAIFRLTPDKYHYNHVPVSGKVVDFYTVEGQYHSCNPSAQIALASLYSKNRREVTVIDTDVDGGSGVGLVAMIEIVALMIGDIVQCYSTEKYTNPKKLERGMYLNKGCPKSLFRPGSSTDVILFEPDRIEFANDLVINSRRKDVQSRFTHGFSTPLVETDVKVRSAIARAKMNK